MNSDPTAHRDFPGCLWRPSATLKTLQQRAALLRLIRQFFDARAVLEVETPVLSQHATVDRHIESFHTAQGAWLQTSPEFAMKRLLCAGSGAIWQLCKVFRREEAGRHHNPEFSMLEWYQPGYDHHRLMDEVEELLRHCGVTAAEPFQRLSYRAAFEQLRAGGFIYPCTCSRKDIQQAAQAPHAVDDEVIYPGTCRAHLKSEIPNQKCCWRFRVPDGEAISFVDGALGPQVASLLAGALQGHEASRQQRGKRMALQLVAIG